MAKRQKLWASKKRVWLLELFNNKCGLCGSEENLEFDCIECQGDRHHRMDTSHRMSFYLAQLKAKNLQLLCSPCHSKKTKNEMESQPF